VAVRGVHDCAGGVGAVGVGFGFGGGEGRVVVGEEGPGACEAGLEGGGWGHFGRGSRGAWGKLDVAIGYFGEERDVFMYFFTSYKS
jgi:hypothetical protein